nr:uncharacterized protein LOC110383979 [Helicoverpa armigera]
MAFSIVLSTVWLLFVSVNAAPKHDWSITIPPECQGVDGFCSVRPEGYDEIEKKFQELLPPFIQNFDSRSSDETFSPEFDQNDNCPYISSWESVYTYMDASLAEPNIIVQTNNFPQKFQKVLCKATSEGKTGVGKQCFTKLGLGVFEKKFECRETKATRSLIVYDPKTHTLKPKTFYIPVSCSCHAMSL